MGENGPASKNIDLFHPPQASRIIMLAARTPNATRSAPCGRDNDAPGLHAEARHACAQAGGLQLYMYVGRDQCGGLRNWVPIHNGAVICVHFINGRRISSHQPPVQSSRAASPEHMSSSPAYSKATIVLIKMTTHISSSHAAVTGRGQDFAAASCSCSAFYIDIPGREREP